MAQAAAANVKTRPAATPTVWKWSGKTRQGEVRLGEMEAQDSGAVEARLRQLGIEPTRVRRKPREITLRIPGFSGVSTKDILVFTRQFSVMIDAGLPLVQALDIIATQADNPVFRAVLQRVKVRVESGATFAEALAEHPKAFVELVRAGEIGGILDTILQRLGAYIEKNEKLKRRVRGAMVYPAIVLTVAVGVVVVLIAFVVPTFEKMFKDFGGAMPAPTQFLIDLSYGFRKSWYLFLGTPVAAFVAFKAATKKGRGQEIWHAVVLKMPMFGTLARKV